MGYIDLSVKQTPKAYGRKENVQTVKPNPQNDSVLRQAAVMLKNANAALSSAKKQADAAKTTIAAWLLENRQINVDTLPIGEIVNIDGVALIEIGKQNRFDQKAFALAQPTLTLEFTREFPTVKVKPLV